MSAPGAMASGGQDRLPDRAHRRILLLGSVFVVSACGLGYELSAGAMSSYLIGDPVTQFSLVIGSFLVAMGLGAHLSRYARGDLLATFVHLEIAVALVGGSSSVLVFAASAYAEGIFPVVFYGLCVAIGALVGAEIPILVRILRRDGRELREALSNTLALDYMGALAGSVALPLVALPYLGLSRISSVFGLMNLGAAFLGTGLLERGRRRARLRVAVAAVFLGALLVASRSLVGFLEDELYDDDIVYAGSSAHQRIVLTRFRHDLRLYLNGHIQFSSVDEARYHEALVMPAMEAAGRPTRVLLLGGGDGLAARRILSYPAVSSLTVVDLDPTMTALARERPELRRLNHDAFRDPRVHIRHQDAFVFLRTEEARYDVILADLPDPSTSGLARLYSRTFYQLALRRLSEHGAFATHATSPFFARRAFWTIVASLEAAARPAVEGLPRRVVTPYHLNVPSFGEWGFAIAAPPGVDVRALSPSVETDYLNPGAWRAMFAFGEDLARPEGIRPNQLDDPTVQIEYRRGWQSY